MPSLGPITRRGDAPVLVQRYKTGDGHPTTPKTQCTSMICHRSVPRSVSRRLCDVFCRGMGWVSQKSGHAIVCPLFLFMGAALLRFGQPSPLLLLPSCILYLTCGWAVGAAFSPLVSSVKHGGIAPTFLSSSLTAYLSPLTSCLFLAGTGVACNEAKRVTGPGG